MDLIYSFSRRGWGKSGIVISGSCEYHFIIVHENLVKPPSNNISIPIGLVIEKLRYPNYLQ